MSSGVHGTTTPAGLVADTVPALQLAIGLPLPPRSPEPGAGLNEMCVESSSSLTQLKYTLLSTARARRELSARPRVIFVTSPTNISLLGLVAWKLPTVTGKGAAVFVSNEFGMPTSFVNWL